MSLQRAWRRQLAAAGAAAALVPAAAAAALAVLALAGGFTGLDALRQVFAGPPSPAAGIALRAPSSQRTPGAVLARLPPAAALAPSATAIAPGAAVGSGSTGAPRLTGPAAGGVGGRNQGSRSGSGRAGGSPAAGGVPQPPGVGAAPPPTAPAPHPTLIDPVISAASSLTSQVPGPAGNLATATLQSVGATVDGVLAPQAGHSGSP